MSRTDSKKVRIGLFLLYKTKLNLYILIGAKKIFLINLFIRLVFKISVLAKSFAIK